MKEKLIHRIEEGLNKFYANTTITTQAVYILMGPAMYDYYASEFGYVSYKGHVVCWHYWIPHNQIIITDGTD
jgi:hypothetical protein